MKGPGGRLKFDVRRQWLCPRCQRRERVPGDVVQHACPKCSNAESVVWMALVEEPRVVKADAAVTPAQADAPSPNSPPA